MLAIFDVDGVLVDTFDLHKKAYAACGVDVPDYSFGRSWRDWLPQHVGSFEEAERINRRKRQAQLEMLQTSDVPLLAGADVIKELTLDGWKTALCSHSDLMALDAIVNRCGLAGIHLPRRSTGGNDKAWPIKKLVSELCTAYEPAVYVDDNDDEGRRVSALAGVPFVPFVNDVKKLYSEIVHATGA